MRNRVVNSRWEHVRYNMTKWKERGLTGVTYGSKAPRYTRFTPPLRMRGKRHRAGVYLILNFSKALVLEVASPAGEHSIFCLPSFIASSKARSYQSMSVRSFFDRLFPPGVSTTLPPRSWNRMYSSGLKPRLCTITDGMTAKNEELSLMLSLRSCIFSMPSANVGYSFKTGAKGAKKRRQRCVWYLPDRGQWRQKTAPKVRLVPILQGPKAPKNGAKGPNLRGPVTEFQLALIHKTQKMKPEHKSHITWIPDPHSLLGRHIVRPSTLPE